MPGMKAFRGLGMSRQGARRVVILADDDGITSNLAPFLERSGLTVYVASDGEAVLELVERLDPDGCILDVLMPRLDGREVLRRLRADGRWLPVVLLTQAGESAERAIALDEGPTITSTSRSTALLRCAFRWYAGASPRCLAGSNGECEIVEGDAEPVNARGLGGAGAGNPLLRDRIRPRRLES
jgi:CheY-like chemotaxis protein